MDKVFKLVGDLKFFYLARTAKTLGPADVQVEGKDLLRDPGLETAILISLFSDSRADRDDKLPADKDLRGGYWGSLLTNFQIGSKLWLLRRMKINEGNLRLWEQYCVDSLNWMKRDGIAETIEAEAVRGARNSEVNFSVRVFRRQGDDILFRFYVNWEYQTVGGLQ